MKRLLLAPLAALVLIAGCGLLPKAPDATSGFNKLFSDAVAVDDGLVLLGTSMLNSGAITSTQARKVLAITDRVKDTLDAAHAAYQLGNLLLANSRLSEATAQLTTAQSCVHVPDAKTTLDVCLAPIGAP